MAGEQQFEQLIENLRGCLARARELRVEHAVCLLNMTIMEVSEKYVDASKPAAPEGAAPGFQPRDSV